MLLGDGPLESDLRCLISDLRLDDYVYLPGFKQYQELPIYYALASAFVHASTSEQWGLVVNEAIASGLPLIVSEQYGCAPELVKDNGFTFDAMNQDELASRLLQMTTLSDDKRRRLSDASYRIAAEFSPDRFGEGLEQAAQIAIKRQKRIGLIDRALLSAAAIFGR